MGRVPREVLDEIKSRVRLSTLIGEYVQLKADGSGGRSKGLCPFHNERTPSFHVMDDRQFYYCFGCGASGDAFKFLETHSGMTFFEAVQQLAARAGVDLPEVEIDRTEEDEKQRARRLYLSITELARDVFVADMGHSSAEEARAYLTKRGIDEDTAAAFQLGFARASWSRLVDEAASRGIGGAYLVRAGLAKERSGGGHYDLFRNRIMFPVLDLAGRVLAFSGRTLDPEDVAKYINSPETRFYKKGDNLYGLHIARRYIRQRNQSVLVEGNFDVVSLHAAGISEAVAPLGTALTPRQADLLRRFSERVVLAFDGDRAGLKAADRAFEVLLAAGIEDVRLIRFEEGDDPDSFVQREGGEAFRQRIDTAPQMLDIVIERALEPALIRRDPVTRRRALEAVGQWLGRVKDDFVRRQVREDVARRLELNTRDVRQAETAMPEPVPPPDAEWAEDAPPPPERLQLTQYEQALIFYIDERPERLERILIEELFRLVPNERFSSWLQRVAQSWRNLGGRLDEIPEVQGDAGVWQAAMAALSGGGLAVRGGDAEFDILIEELKRNWLTARMRQLQQEIERADRSGAYDDVEAAMKEMERLANLLP